MSYVGSAGGAGASGGAPRPTRADATRQVSDGEVVGLTREVARGGISRRQFLVRAAALGLTTSAIGTVLAACGTGDEEAGRSSRIEKVVPEELIFYNWTDYLAPVTKKNFEKETGIKLERDVLRRQRGAVRQAQRRRHRLRRDVPVRLHGARADHGRPRDAARHVADPELQERRPQVPEADASTPRPTASKYSVPYQWGTTGIGVRTDKVPETVTSWQTMWDPSTRARSSWTNEMRETIGAALKLLGYSLNSTSEDELTEAGDKLIEQKPLVAAYDTNNMKRNMIQGTPLVHAWNADALLVMDEIGQDKLAYVLPDEGFTVWVDCLAIPTGANSPYGAHLWMDFICDVKNQAELTDWVWYLLAGAGRLRPHRERAPEGELPDAGTARQR